MLKFKTSCAVLAYLSSNLLNEVSLSLFRYFKVGLRVCDIVVKKFTFAISSPDEFLSYITYSRKSDRRSYRIITIYILANVNSRSRLLYAIARQSVVCLSVTSVHPTQPVKIFGTFSSPFGTLAIH